MNLSVFFKENPKAAVAFSGGVDSAYLLYAAKAAGADVRAYYVKSAFQPQFEMEDARRLCGELDMELKTLTVDVLADCVIRENPADRCYHCKRIIFTTIAEAAAADGYTLLLDGTNASDEEGDRPGMRALRELSVRSPCGNAGLPRRRYESVPRRQGFLHGRNRHMPVWRHGYLRERKLRRKS